MTELKRFTDAYATMTVATYEPLIMSWWSGISIAVLGDQLAWRMQKSAKLKRVPKGFSTTYRISIAGRNRATIAPDVKIPSSPRKHHMLKDVDGKEIASLDVHRIETGKHPDAVAVDGILYPRGSVDHVDNDKNRELGQPTRPLETLTTFSNTASGLVDIGFDYASNRKRVMARLFGTFKNAANLSDKDIEKALFEGLGNIQDKELYEFLPRGGLQEALSPVGISHYYRQHYFNLNEGVGPLEQAFTIAPKESLEVVYETTRRQVHEEELEIGSETISESAAETKNLDEISDKVSSMVQRDFSASMSANASGTVGVWSGGASATANFGTSAERSREVSTRRLKETTKRASERITNSFTLKTRDVLDITETSLTRRVITNEAPTPVSYGLRRVLRKVRCKVQYLGPRLVWQLYIKDPGRGLGVSRFVLYREDQEIAVPEIPPGVPPRPSGGTETGTTTRTVESGVVDEGEFAGQTVNFIQLKLLPGPDRRVQAVSIDTITDLEGGGGMSSDDEAPAPLDIVQWDATTNPATGEYSVKVGIKEGDASAVSVSYSYSWVPAPHVLTEWEALRKQAVAQAKQEALAEQFEQEKAKITEKSQVRTRPPNELRREERYEVLGRMVSHIFARGDDPSEPTPLEIEYFHRFFDVEAMFTYSHPSWWKPRYVPKDGGLGHAAYPVTSESEPAKLGSSLGWKLQIDGDNRRNEFLNSPWIRVCIPVRPTREREALKWLAKHIEGAIGYDPNKNPLKSLLADLEKVRSEEQSLGTDGPDYVTVDSSPGAPAEPLTPEAIFPIVDEFDVTVPTDGFVYDTLEIVDS